MTIRRILGAAATIGLVVSGAILLWKMRDLALAIAASWALAAGTQPPIEALRRRGVSRPLALLVTYGIVLGVVTAFVAIIGGPLLEEIGRATDQLSAAYERLLGRWAHGARAQRSVAAALPSTRVLFKALAELRPAELASGALTLSAAVIGLAIKLIILFVLSVYWSLYRDAAYARGLFLAPARLRAKVRRVLAHVEAGVGRHVLSEGTKSILSVGVLGILYHLLGLEMPTLPATFAGLARIVPFAGAALAMAAAALAAAPSGPLVVALAAGLTGAWIFFSDKVLIPRLLDSRLYNPVLVIVVVVTITPAYGWAGLIVAPALAAAFQLIGESTLLTTPLRLGSLSTERGLRERYEALRRRLAGRPPVSPEVLGLFTKLEQIVAELDATSPAGSAAPPSGSGATSASGAPARTKGRPGEPRPPFTPLSPQGGDSR